MEKIINKKVRRYIEQSDTFDYGHIKEVTEDLYLIKPTCDDRKEQYWVIEECEILD